MAKHNLGRFKAEATSDLRCKCMPKLVGGPAVFGPPLLGPSLSLESFGVLDFWGNSNRTLGDCPQVLGHTERNFAGAHNCASVGIRGIPLASPSQGTSLAISSGPIALARRRYA